MPEILGYVGSAVIVAWGVAHIAPTRSVVAGFGSISTDNRRILTMEWVAEGLTLVFLGVLVLTVSLVAPPPDPVSVAVYRLTAAMLLVMAAWTGLTGARTPTGPMKACPIVKTLVAGTLLAASLI